MMIKEKPTVFVLYQRKNRWSFNALVASLLQANFHKKVNFSWITTTKDLYQALPRFSPSLVLLSSASTEKEEKRNIARTVKTNYPETILCGGGPHLSAHPEDFSPFVSIVVKGEGEAAIREIVATFLQRELPLETQIISSSPVDLDYFPPFPYQADIFGPIEITRGCPFACAFCQTSFLFGTQVRHRSISTILEYVRLMKKKDLLDLRFITPNALAYGSPDGKSPCPKTLANLLFAIRKTVGKRGRIFFGSFPSEVRPEFLSPEIVRLLKETVDNDNLVIGAQSGSNQVLARMHRQHTKEDVIRAVELSLQAGFKVNVDFLFGCPDENEAEEEENLSTVLTLSRMGAKIHAHIFMPLPGTPWSMKRYSPLSPRTKKILGRLAQEGKLFGQWYTQERHAQILGLGF
ncbi:MAG: TIGR04013 family B12-binding domain/radical SAM domain-containing protein [Candidatus Caldatribacteriaceae bacterium]